ncbi:hypothetical protein CAPTEDRAFT_136391 [Capitella teleta]|uniref:Tctex1 domain-containing protein 2 n=1 Tax=Capitella teleta TaxID=283909 RepID=R7UJ08_CAPTE|nr:hypothetical protein CAPTEDRAFT_136391 [Capitella teleta]|eukprot:ELU03272.1 hypothetical protein CAPTEDRAFT_136391 [Capitella teleta]
MQSSQQRGRQARTAAPSSSGSALQPPSKPPLTPVIPHNDHWLNRPDEHEQDAQTQRRRYKMAPDEKQRFRCSQIAGVIERVLQSALQGQLYDEERSRELTAHLSEEIRKEVKQLGYERHKVVCHVYLGQPLSQGIEISSQFLGNADADSWAMGTFHSDALLAAASV